jgi:microcystin-dependent protein
MGVEIQVGGSWKEAADRTPVGLISAFGGTVAPDGWFLCDGSTKSRTTYADLYAVIGTTFGAGDGVSTFNLPNLQGVGLTGIGSQNINGRAKAGPSLGAAREDQMQGHWHNVKNGASNVTFTATAADGSYRYVWSGGSQTVVAKDLVTDGTNGTPRIGAYTHGPEVGVNFIIKY